MTATVPATPEAFRPPGYERIDVTLRFVDGAFAVPNDELALIDAPAGRCLLVIDRSVLAIHDTRITAYFHAHGIELAGV